MKAQVQRIIETPAKNISRLFDLKNHLVNVMENRDDVKTIGTTGFLLAKINSYLNVNMNFDLFEVLSLLVKMAELGVASYTQLKYTLDQLIGKPNDYLACFTSLSKKELQAAQYHISCSLLNEEPDLFTMNTGYSIECLRDKMSTKGISHNEFVHLTIIANELIEFYELAIAGQNLEEYMSDYDMYMEAADLMTS